MRYKCFLKYIFCINKILHEKQHQKKGCHRRYPEKLLYWYLQNLYTTIPINWKCILLSCKDRHQNIKRTNYFERFQRFDGVTNSLFIRINLIFILVKMGEKVKTLQKNRNVRFSKISNFSSPFRNLADIILAKQERAFMFVCFEAPSVCGQINYFIYVWLELFLNL